MGMTDLQFIKLPETADSRIETAEIQETKEAILSEPEKLKKDLEEDIKS